MCLELIAHETFFGLPFHAKGRVGKHVVKLLARVAIVRHEVARLFGILQAQGVAIDHVVDGLVLDQQV
jgi:hypothetical protein